MDRRIVIGGGIVAVAVVLLGVRLASNSGAKSGLDAALAHLPPGFTATHGAVTYSALTGEARVRDLALFRNGAPAFTAAEVLVSGIGAQDATGTPSRVGEIIVHDASGGPYKHIARIDLSGVYPATLREVFDPSAYPGGKPAWTDKRLVLEHGEIHGVDGSQTVMQPKLGAINSSFNVGSWVIDRLALSQLPAAPDPNMQPIALAAEVEAHMSGESWTMKDLAFAATGKSPVRGAIARMSSGKNDGGRVADFSLQGMSVTTDTPAGTMTVDSASGHNLDASKLLALVPMFAADPATPHPEILGSMHLQSFEMHGMRADYPAGPLVRIDTISARAATDGAPYSGKFDITGLTVKTSGRPVSPAARAQLDSFGMADFTTDLIEEGGFDSAAGQLSFKRFDMVFHDLGTLHVKTTISGIAAASPGMPTQMQMIQAVGAARLTDASVVWEDNSLTQRLLKMVAAKQGMTPDQVRIGLAMPLASLAVLMPDQPDAVTQVNAFLTGQHKLEITAKPAVPVGIAQWQATPVPQRAALLGLRVSGN